MPNQPPTDRQDAAGKAEARAAHEYVDEQPSAAFLLLKLITVPFWAPFFLASAMKERREIRAFILEQAPGQPITNALVRELTVAWAERNPKRYPHGRYGRKFDRLKVRFESTARLLQQRRGY